MSAQDGVAIGGGRDIDDRQQRERIERRVHPHARLEPESPAADSFFRAADGAEPLLAGRLACRRLSERRRRRRDRRRRR